MITIDINSNAQEVLRQVREFPPRMAAAIARAMDLQNQFTIGHAQHRYLRGPRPLKLGVRTRRLSGSLSAAPARVTANEVVSSIGTNVEYAGVHERGFDGPVTVRSHKRNIFRTHQTGGGAFFDPATGRVKKQKPRKISLLQGQATVRSFTRHMRMPARPFLAPSIEDRRQKYSDAISAAIVKAWEGPASAP